MTTASQGVSRLASSLRAQRAVVLLCLACPVTAAQPADRSFDVHDATIADMQDAVANGTVTYEQLTLLHLNRIGLAQERLRAIVAVNPKATGEAYLRDQKKRAGAPTSPLFGIPIVLKDNIDFAGGLATTAGSLALAENFPKTDAEVTRRLIDAGAIIIAKANLSEWANIRSSWSTSGWSAVGGLTRNPYDRDRSACGSSSGSAVAVAAGLAPGAIGTETDGSITCPASMTGIVGLKPTVGLVSRRGIVPISDSQDTAGPMARTVRDAAAVLTVIAGTDERDPATLNADVRRVDYVAGLDAQALKGARIGVLRVPDGYHPDTIEVFEKALASLKAKGAELVDIAALDLDEIYPLELDVLLTEFKHGLNQYLATTPPGVETRTLAEVIAFNRSEPRETVLFGQDLFEKAEATKGLTDRAYLKAKDTARRLAREQGIDRLLKEYRVSALVAPTTGPAWTMDLVNGNASGQSASTLPAVAGYPHLTVPMGQVGGLPVGLSFIGPAWSEQLLLSMGYAFEQASHARMPPKEFWMDE